MSWRKFLSTDKLKQVIETDISKLGYPDCDYPLAFLEEKALYSFEGTYVFANSIGYHDVYFERGSETTHRVTDDLFEIRFWVAESLASELAFRFAREVKLLDQDMRRLLFYRRLELLGRIGPNFEKLGEIKVNDILRRVPYSS
jgi:hypothetical protein